MEDTAAPRGSSVDEAALDAASGPFEPIPAEEVLPPGWTAAPLVGAFPPATGPVVQLLLTPDGRLVAATREGDARQMWWVGLTAETRPPADGRARPVRLDGVPETALGARRLEAPTWALGAVHLLAGDDEGRRAVWRLDAEGVAMPLPREGLPGGELERLAGGPGLLAAANASDVVFRGGTGRWTRLTATTTAPVEALAADGTVAAPEVVVVRAGRAFLHTADRTVAEQLVQGRLRDVLRLAAPPARTVWVDGDTLVQQRDDGRRLALAIRALPGPDVVRDPAGTTLAAVTDGGVALVDARGITPIPLPELEAITALTLARLEGRVVLAVAGRDGPLVTLRLVDTETGRPLR